MQDSASQDRRNGRSNYIDTQDRAFDSGWPLSVLSPLLTEGSTSAKSPP